VTVGIVEGAMTDGAFNPFGTTRCGLRSRNRVGVELNIVMAGRYIQLSSNSNISVHIQVLKSPLSVVWEQ